MSHTPGPWTVAGTAHSVSKTFGVKSADALWVAKCHPFNGQTDDRAIAKANARLMAAAPELRKHGHKLAVLALQSEQYQQDEEYRAAVNAVIAAVDKADGR